MAVRAAIGGFIVLALQGCAGEQFSLGSSTRPPTDDALPGRWLLTTPNAPPRGLEFGGAPGARNGKVAPDGGCPGDFYTSRRWAMEGSLSRSQTNAMSLWLNSNSPETNSKADLPPAPP